MPESSLEPGAGRLWVDIDTPQEVVAIGRGHILETRFGASLFMTVGPVDGEPDVVLTTSSAWQAATPQSSTVSASRRVRSSSP